MNKFLALATVLCMFSMLALAGAVSLGVSPATISVDNMLRGGYAETTVLVSTSSSDVLTGTISASGDIADWLTFEPRTFEIEPNSMKSLKAIIQPPEDVANGEYNGTITISVRVKDDESGSGHGMSIGAAAGILTDVAVSDRETKDYKVTEVSVKDIEENHPLEVLLKAVNTGNVRVTPEIRIDILDQKRENVIKSVDYSDTEILPTVSEDIIISIPTDDLKLGQYWARVTAYLEGKVIREETLTFDLLERGALRVKGSLVSVTAGAWAEAGDLVELAATFSNEGEMITLAKARFEIYSTETPNATLIEVLDSEEVRVEIGETMDLNAYYRPSEPGTYEIRGIVFYSMKITDEKTTLLNVRPKPVEEVVEEEEAQMSFDFIVPLAIIAAALLALLFFKKRSAKGRKKRRHSIS